MAVRRKSTTLILVGVLVFLLGGVGVLIVLTRGNNSPKTSTVATQPAANATTPATTTNGSTLIGAASLHIPAGDVAISLGLTSTQAVGGFPVAGDELDIYGTFKDQPAHTSLQAPLAKLAMSDIKILSIQEAGPSTTPGSTVVELAVTPTQAESLIYMTTYEGIYTTLVRPGSTASPTTPGRDASNILAPSTAS